MLIGLLALSGCGWFSPSSSKSTTEACPSAGHPAAACQHRRFRFGEQRRPDNVAFYGLLSEADLKCEYTGDAVRMILEVDRRSANAARPAKADSVDFQYFVAVTGPDQTILSKKQFPVRIGFDTPPKARRHNRSYRRDNLAGRPQGCGSQRVLGFQQSPEVVDFYKRFRGR